MTFWVKRQHFSGRLNIIIICRDLCTGGRWLWWWWWQCGDWYWFLFLPSDERQNCSPEIPLPLPPCQIRPCRLTEVIMHIISPPGWSSSPVQLNSTALELFFIWLAGCWLASLGFSFPKNINLKTGIKTWSHVTLWYCHDGILTFDQIKRASASMIKVSRKWNYDISKIDYHISQAEISIRRKESSW